MKEEFYLEDEDRVTKQLFLKWIKQKNKGLSPPSLLREVKKQFDQLSVREQMMLGAKKVELFVEAADATLQKSLVKDLEDPKGKLGLTDVWRKVPKVISLIVKRQKRSNKFNVSIDDEVPAIPSSSNGSKNKQEEMLEDVTKQLRDLRLNYKKVDKILSSVKSTQTSQRQDSQK